MGVFSLRDAPPLLRWGGVSRPIKGREEKTTPTLQFGRGKVDLSSARFPSICFFQKRASIATA
jgi:hypothetical protein